MKPLLCVIETDADKRERIARICIQSGWGVRRFASLEEFQRVRIADELHLLIYKAPSELSNKKAETEISKLRMWREAHKSVQLLLLLPKNLNDSDRLALILGARHMLHEPWQETDLAQILAMVAQGVGKRARRQAVEKILSAGVGFEDIIGNSKAIVAAIELARKVAESDTTSILITGECGTGKGSFARAIHHASPRREGPYIEVNCAAIPKNLLESEFFGYEPGAFTDARREKMGLFECANGGTIFLDEVSEIDFALQAKLLKFLDSRLVRRLSGTRFMPVDVRIISATNRDLSKAVAERRFREDLFYRLNVVEIHIPPLRERKEDIRLIASEYARRFSARMGKGEIKFSDDAFEALENYDWPGNVRELINSVERAVLLNLSGTISGADFPFTPSQRAITVPVREERERIVIDIPQEGISLEAAERALIEAALARADGNITRAARLLRVGRGTLRYKIKKFAIRTASKEKNLRSGSFEPELITTDSTSK